MPQQCIAMLVAGLASYGLKHRREIGGNSTNKIFDARNTIVSIRKLIFHCSRLVLLVV